MPARWEAVVGQPAAVAAARASLSRDETAHAWLLVGPDGVGQDEWCRALAAAVNCEQAKVGTEEGCGACGVCTRIAAGASLVYQTFEPTGAMHRVGDVRGTWVPEAMRTMTEGRRRVLRIAQADRMNEATQNAFLKILEEPPPSTLWVLDVPDVSMLLETVTSRCRRLDMIPWGEEIIRQAAQDRGATAERASVLARAALGSPQRLQRLLDDPAAHDRHLAVVGRLSDEGPGLVVPLAREIVGWGATRARALEQTLRAEFEQLALSFGVEGRTGRWPPGVKAAIEASHKRQLRHEPVRCLHQFLDDLATWLRDLLVLSAGGSQDDVLNADRIAALRRDVGRLPAVAAVAGLRAIDQAREGLERNAQPQVTVERVLMALAVPLYQSAA